MAILSVTGEWSQRTGLITFTLVPHRSQVILAKAIAAVIVGVVSMLLAFAIGAVGNIVGSALNGVDAAWDTTFADFLLIILANILGLLVGFMLGVLIRSTRRPRSSPTSSTRSCCRRSSASWPRSRTGSRTSGSWIDFGVAQTPLFEGDLDRGAVGPDRGVRA